jgi:hypothetical protein
MRERRVFRLTLGHRHTSAGGSYGTPAADAAEKAANAGGAPASDAAYATVADLDE